MAIEFNCPYCTAPIRVPDSAAGKRGTCPRCKTGILVPKVKKKSRFQRGKSQPDPAPAAEPESEPTESPPAKPSQKPSLRERFHDEPDFTGLDETAPANETAAVSTQPAPPPASVPPPTPPGAAPVVAPIAQALRRRKRGSLLWVPILFGALLVGGVALFFLLQGSARLEGELQATVVGNGSLKSRVVRASEIGVDKDKVARVLKRLEENPIHFSKFSFSATAAGLTMQPHATASTDVYEVSISGRKALLAYFEDHSARLAEYRRREYEKGLAEFFDEAGRILEDGDTIPDDLLQNFQRRVLANAFIDIPGYHLVASLEGKAYHCICQQGNRLYFLLPKGTKTFRLRGRKLPDGGQQVPARYFVNVKQPATGTGAKTMPQNSDDEKTKPPAKTMDE